MIAIIGALLPVSVVVAVAVPDSMTFNGNGVNSYSGLLEPGDMLFLSAYEVSYASPPVQPVGQAFIATVIDTNSGSYIVRAEALVTDFNTDLSNGYGQGAAAVYFPASAVASEETRCGCVMWENGRYRMRLDGNPASFPVPPVSVQYTVDYRATSTIFGAADLLRIDLALGETAIAKQVGNVWGVALLQLAAEGNLRFTTAGQDYFPRVIAGLNEMVPDLFVVNVTGPDFSEREFGDVYATSLENFGAGNEGWNDLNENFDGIATYTGAPVLWVKFAILTVLAIVLFGYTLRTTGNMQIAMFTVPITLTAGTLTGFAGIELMMMIAAIAALSIAWVFFFRGA
ncbi:hypothetical protein CMI37_29695 [Candidatus Pacearchaeota archaeon]|nr:hypothetical protein [Candidatus Pacearchaeota archaeon]